MFLIKLRKKKKATDAGKHGDDGEDVEQWELSPHQNEPSPSPPPTESTPKVTHEDVNMEYSTSFLEKHSHANQSYSTMPPPDLLPTQSSISIPSIPEIQSTSKLDLPHKFPDSIKPSIPNFDFYHGNLDCDDCEMTVLDDQKKVDLKLKSVCIPIENSSDESQDSGDFEAFKAAETLMYLKSNSNSPQSLPSLVTSSNPSSPFSESYYSEHEGLGNWDSVPEINPDIQPSPNFCEDSENFDTIVETKSITTSQVLPDPNLPQLSPEKKLWQPWIDGPQKQSAIGNNIQSDPASTSSDQGKGSSDHFVPPFNLEESFATLSFIAPQDLSTPKKASITQGRRTFSPIAPPPTYFSHPKNPSPIPCNIPEGSSTLTNYPFDLTTSDKYSVESPDPLSLNSQPNTTQEQTPDNFQAGPSNCKSLYINVLVLENPTDSLTIPPHPPTYQRSAPKSSTSAASSQSSPSLRHSLSPCITPGSRGKRKRSDIDLKTHKRLVRFKLSKSDPELGRSAALEGETSTTTSPAPSNASKTMTPSGGPKVQRDEGEETPPLEVCNGGQAAWQARLAMYWKLREGFGVNDDVALHTLREMFKPALDLYESHPEALDTWLSLMCFAFLHPSSTSKFIKLVLEPIVLTLRAEKNSDIELLIVQRLEIELTLLIKNSNPIDLYVLREKVMSLEYIMINYHVIWNILELIRLKNVENNQPHPLTLINLTRIACILYITNNDPRPLEIMLYRIKTEVENVNSNFSSNIVILMSIFSYLLQINKSEIVLLLLDMFAVTLISKPGELNLKEIQIILNVKVNILLTLGKHADAFNAYFVMCEIRKTLK